MVPSFAAQPARPPNATCCEVCEGVVECSGVAISRRRCREHFRVSDLRPAHGGLCYHWRQQKAVAAGKQQHDRACCVTTALLTAPYVHTVRYGEDVAHFAPCQRVRWSCACAGGCQALCLLLPGQRCRPPSHTLQRHFGGAAAAQQHCHRPLPEVLPIRLCCYLRGRSRP